MSDQTYAQQKGTNFQDKDKKWELVQIKAFKSWVNTSLQAKGLPPVDDLKSEFQDGIKLIAFLEIVTGKPIGQRYDKNPVQKIQKIQNLNIALDFIRDKLGNVKLVGVGAEDIYDGNLKLILGMLWTLFRTLRIVTIKEEGHSSEDALLLWVKKMTAGYDGVNITTFKESFNDGLAFSALINKYDEKLLNYRKLSRDNKEENLENAFSIAESNMGIPKLLEAADLMSGAPDERSVVLYVSLFFHAFVANEENMKSRREQEEITKKMTELESLIEELNDEKEELVRNKKTLEERVSELERQAQQRERDLAEANEKAKLLESELEFMRQRALRDAEAIALLEEKNRILSELLEHENLEKGEIEEARARLLAELEELRTRGRQLAGDKENLDEMKKRLITENDKKEGVLRDLEARKNALMNEIDQLRALVNREMEKRRQAARQALQLKKELDDLKKKLIAQGRARIGLDVLRRNLEEHLEDMYRWRELHDLAQEDKDRVFDLNKVMDDLKDKSFDQQIEYLDDQLQAENKSLLRIIRLKDSQFKLKEIEVKSGLLSMKGRKDWKKRWFSLRGFTLFYFENEEAQRCEGFVDLNKGCEVVRQKAVKEDDSAKKQWPLKITVGDRKLFVRAVSKKERHSWYLFLASKIAHLNYLKSVEATGNRPDTRLITLFTSESVTDLHLDHRPIPEEAAVALAKTLPAHDETETLSLVNTGLDDNSLKQLAEVLEKLSVKSLILSNNKITSVGAEELAKGIAANVSLTEINLEKNEIDDRGVAALAANIASKPALTALNLNGNRIGLNGVKALVEHLSTPDHPLPELHLANNHLDDAAVGALGALLSKNSTIQHVNLSGNKIGNAGAKALAQSLLSDDSNILSLDLSNNEIGNEGALALQHLLEKNHSLAKVDLSNNKNLVGSPELASLLSGGFHFPNLTLTRS